MPAPKEKATERLNRAIGTVIAATRRDADFTQENLAASMDWHRSTIAKIEAGEIGVKAADLILIAQVLNTDPEVLFRRILRW